MDILDEKKIVSKKNSVLWQLLKFMIGRGKAKSVTIDICVLFSSKRRRRNGAGKKNMKIFMVKKYTQILVLARPYVMT